MFSFNNLSKKKKAICKIEGGEYDGRIVYLNDKNNPEPDGEYEDFDELVLNDGKFSLTVDPSAERQILAFFGPSGSGKSYLMKKYLKEYEKLYKNNPIYLFSKKKTDVSLSDVKKLKRAIIDESLVTHPMPYEFFTDSIVVFDDIDTLNQTTKVEKAIRSAVINIKDDILELGRDRRISTLISSHLATKGHETKTLLNESHMIVIYPSSGANYAYLMNKYMGLDSKQIKRIKDMDSRWVCFSRQYPNIVFSEREILAQKNL